MSLYGVTRPQWVKEWWKYKCILCFLKLNSANPIEFCKPHRSRVTLYTAGHLHTAVPHCSHSRVPIVHTAVPRENNEHGCVYLRCSAVCKLPGCVEGHPCRSRMGHGQHLNLNMDMAQQGMILSTSAYDWSLPNHSCGNRYWQVRMTLVIPGYYQWRYYSLVLNLWHSFHKN